MPTEEVRVAAHLSTACVLSPRALRIMRERTLSLCLQLRALQQDVLHRLGEPLRDVAQVHGALARGDGGCGCFHETIPFRGPILGRMALDLRNCSAQAPWYKSPHRKGFFVLFLLG